MILFLLAAVLIAAALLVNKAAANRRPDDGSRVHGDMTTTMLMLIAIPFIAMATDPGDNELGAAFMTVIAIGSNLRPIRFLLTRTLGRG